MACRWPAEAPLSEVRRYACGGSSPPPWVPCPLPPHLSADTLLPAELNQWTPAFTPQLWPTRRHLVLCTNERTRAAKAHRVTDSRHTTAIIRAGYSSLRRCMADVSSRFQLLPAHCLVGQLSHSVELLLHLACFCVTTGRSSHFTYLIDRMKSDLRADLRQTTRFSFTTSSFRGHWR